MCYSISQSTTPEIEEKKNNKLPYFCALVIISNKNKFEEEVNTAAPDITSRSILQKEISTCSCNQNYNYK